MSVNGDERRRLLERYGRAYAQHGFAVIWTAGLEGEDAKKVTTAGWQTTAPLSSVDFAAGLFAERGLRRNPAVTARTSNLILVDCDTPEGLAELEQLKLPATWTVRSSADWKRHFYFRPPRAAEQLPRVGFRFEAGGFTADANRYLVAPPALHPDTGEPYQFLPGLGPDEIELAELPLDVYTELLRRGEKAAAETEAVIADPDAKIQAGKRRESIFRHACMQRRWGLSEAAIVDTCMRFNEERCNPPLSREQVAHQVAGAMKKAGGQELTGAKPVYQGPVHALDDVVAVFRKWLHLPDPGALHLALATVAANRMPGDPVWLLLVAASSSGKTEILLSLADLEEVEPAATLTEAALLSGVGRKDVAKGATGGLLKKVGDYGILTLKDFGSVLSMHRDARAAVLAALREVYDGSWDRPIGADGGKTLHWDGKLGLIAGVTTVVDRHHAVMDALGSRFALYRSEVDERIQQARRALAHRRGAREMRDELRDAVSGFFAGLEIPESTTHTLSESDVERLIALADLVTLARSPVERDPYASREIELIPDPEAPARFAGMLAAILEGLRVIELGETEIWALVRKVAFDSMPAQRRRLLEHLARVTEDTTKGAATLLGLPTTTARRTLEDLAAHGVVERVSGGEGKADVWRLPTEIRLSYAETTVPEMSQFYVSNTPNPVNDDISGTVVEPDE